MTHLFYLIGIIFFIYEFYTIFNPIKIQTLIGVIKGFKNSKNIKSDMSISQASFIIFLMSPYMFWNIIGLFSSQWVLFLILIGLGWITFQLKKLYNDFTYKVSITFIDSILSVLLIGYLIMNHFHHFDIIKLF